MVRTNRYAFARGQRAGIFTPVIPASANTASKLAVNWPARPRPLTVEIAGSWRGFAMPSRPVAVLAATAVNVLYALVPA